MENGLSKEFKVLAFCQTKIHQSIGCLDFLKKCKRFGILPKFTTIPKSLLNEVNWGKIQIRKKRLEKLDVAIIEQENRLQLNKTKFNQILSRHFSHLSQSDVHRLVSSVFNYVQRQEMRTDRNRRRKLENLRFFQPKEFESIVLSNWSNVEVPNYISDILKYGSELAIGRSPDDYKILLEIEKLLAKWDSYAEKNGISAMKRFTARGDFIHSFKLLTKCFSSNHDGKKLKQFLNSHPDICLVKVDKSKNLVFLNKSDYEQKLKDEFPVEKYEQLKKDSLQNDLKKFSHILRSMEPFVPQSTFWQMRPIPSLKSAYGLLKMHKAQPYPVRPIVSSLNSITSGAEDYLLPILEKFLPKCVYSVESTKSFSEFFLRERSKFYLPRSQILSFDVKSLFPSVDLDFVIEHVIETIYKNPSEYFEAYVREDGRMVRPPKYIFKKFLTSVLKEFTAFKTIDSYYRQIDGCSMGSKLAPILSNIFMSLIETKVVDPLIKSKHVVGYKKYVDDCFIVLRNRDDIDFVFDKFNSAHKGLIFTKDLPIDGILNFLDLSIYFDRLTNKYEFKQYSKEIKSNVLQNFKFSCSPLSYKNGTLIGEIYRVKYCSSNIINLNNSLKSLEEKFVKNGYPRKLVRDKIKEVRERNFQKKVREFDFEKEKHENPDRFHTLCLNFTSERCQKVERFIRNFIREITPDFNVMFAWKSVSLNNIILPRLKRRVNMLESHSVVYRFKCDCKSEYIGETKRLLADRASEHGQKSRKSEISSHIFECKEYEKCFNLKYFTPGRKERKEFLFSHFEILSKNLSGYRDRTIMEALFIKMYSPKLNIQNDHRNTVII